MEKKKKLIHRIGALICALVLSVSVLGANGIYFAYDDSDTAFLMSQDFPLSEPYIDLGFDSLKSQYLEEYPYYLIFNTYYDVSKSSSGFSETYILFSKEPLYVETYNGSWTNNLGTKYTTRGLRLSAPSSDVVFAYMQMRDNVVSIDLTIKNEWFSTSAKNIFAYKDSSLKYLYTSWCESNYDVLHIDSGEVFFSANGSSGGADAPSYNFNLGYLQNVRENRVYDEVPLGEVVNDKFSARWYYDRYTTTGVDLTSGDYFIRYYQERWLVKGYGDDDIIEKSERYCIGDYIVQNGYIQTYSEDIDDVLISQGYEEPSFFDLLWNKFVVTHHYFQVVNAQTNEVGGYLHVYYTDDDGSFGAEYIGETLDENGEYDENGYKDIIEDNSITTDDIDAGFEELENNNEQTIEEWLENLQSENESINGSVDGSDDLLNVLVGSGNSVNPVSIAVGKVFALFPPQVLLQYGIAVALIFVVIVYRALRG